VDDHHGGEAAGLQMRLAGVACEDAEGGVLRQAEIEADDFVENAKANRRRSGGTGRGACLPPWLRRFRHALIPPSTISMAPVVKLA
jgi:hypothetical protein